MNGKPRCTEAIATRLVSLTKRMMSNVLQSDSEYSQVNEEPINDKPMNDKSVKMK